MREIKKYVGLIRLSQQLGLSPAWLKAEANAGRIPHLVVGRRRLFHLEQVEEILLQRARSDGSTKGIDSEVAPSKAPRVGLNG